MGQTDILDFLQKNPNIEFVTNDLSEQLQLNKTSLTMNLKRMSKRITAPQLKIRKCFIHSKVNNNIYKSYIVMWQTKNSYKEYGRLAYG